MPNRSYGQLLGDMQSHLKGVATYVNEQLQNRGAQAIAMASERLAPIEGETYSPSKLVNEAINNVYNEQGMPVPEMAEYGRRSAGGFNAVERWLQGLPEGTQLDAGSMTAKTPDGRSIQAPPSARTLLEQQRRLRATRERRVND